MISAIPARLVDLHCHILPGIDDGADDDRQAIEMLEIAAEDGIASIVATPHFHHTNARQIRDGVARLNELALQEGIAVTVHPGAEVRIAVDLIEQYQAGELVTINETSYLLLELHLGFSWQIETIELAVGRLIDAGLRPILAHAERYEFIQREPELLRRLTATGTLIQVNASSFAGRHGEAATQTAEQLVNLGLVHLLASDAHNAGRRGPRLRDGYQHVARLAGPQTAARMAERAEMVLAGQPVGVSRGEDW